MRPLEGMVVVITGASSGIGEALARELSARGACLALAARRGDRLDALVRELGGPHLAQVCDVSRSDDCRLLIDRCQERFGRIDTLVCNAGYGIVKPIASTSREDWQAIFATNVLGTTECIRHGVPLMRTQMIRRGWRGQIMIVSSALARRSLPEYGAYAATKAAQLSLSEALRLEMRPLAIAVTSVHPVTTSSEFFRVANSRSGNPSGVDRSQGWAQSCGRVARVMAAAIARPKREVWPLRPARWALALAALCPGLVDACLARFMPPADPDQHGASATDPPPGPPGPAAAPPG